MALTVTGSVSVVAAHTGTTDFVTVSAPLSLAKAIALADGTGANQANRMFHDQRTIAASGTDDLDLAGVLVDALGVTMTLARVKGIYVSAASANTNNVLIGGGTNPLANWVGATGDIVSVRPGGVFFLMAPDVTAYAVTAGTGDILRIGNSAAGTSVTYDIVIIGSTA